MLPFIELTHFIETNQDLKLLLDHIKQSDNEFWLVGGCLRNAFLNLPQTDIDITCSADPTKLIQNWANVVGGKWFWLDAERKQSRVLLGCGLSIDVAMLRAPSIIEDLYLRDFSINSIAYPLSKNFPNVDIIDPLCGLEALENQQLIFSSVRSFRDDPLRVIKGIRHAVALDCVITPKTLDAMVLSAPLLESIAGERILSELDKIFATAGAVRGVELLFDTGVFAAIFGSSVMSCNKEVLLSEIKTLYEQTNKFVINLNNKQLKIITLDSSPTISAYIFASLIKLFKSENVSALLHTRLRFSRHQQRLIEALVKEPDLKLISLASTLDGKRQQALLMERLGPFAVEILLYTGVYRNQLTIERLQQLHQAFEATQQHDRIPDLICGERMAISFGGLRSNQIGVWLHAIKSAEISGDIATVSEAEIWLKRKLII